MSTCVCPQAPLSGPCPHTPEGAGTSYPNRRLLHSHCPPRGHGKGGGSPGHWSLNHAARFRCESAETAASPASPALQSSRHNPREPIRTSAQNEGLRGRTVKCRGTKRARDIAWTPSPVVPCPPTPVDPSPPPLTLHPYPKFRCSGTKPRATPDTEQAPCSTAATAPCAGLQPREQEWICPPGRPRS